MNIRKRLGVLEARVSEDLVVVRLMAGGTATLKGSRIMDIFDDVLRSRDTPETAIVLEAESSTEEGQMIPLMQSFIKSRLRMESEGKLDRVPETGP